MYPPTAQRPIACCGAPGELCPQVGVLMALREGVHDVWDHELASGCRAVSGRSVVMRHFAEYLERLQEDSESSSSGEA